MIKAEEDIRRGSEILMDQIRERGHLGTYPYEALTTHKLNWLKRKRGARLQDELESLVEIAIQNFTANLTAESAERAPNRLFGSI